MRFALLAFSLLLAGCGSPGPNVVRNGPRLQASLAATWSATAPARQTAFSRDGKLVATSDASGRIAVRDARNWRLLEQFEHPGGATSLAFTRDDSQLFSGGYDAAVRDWDLKTRKQVRVFTGARGTIWTVDVSPDGNRLAAAGEDGIIRLWNLSREEAPVQLRGHTRNVWEVRFSPDGIRLASGSFDKSVRLWDVSTGHQTNVLRGHTQAVVGLDFSPSGKLLATGG